MVRIMNSAKNETLNIFRCNNLRENNLFLLVKIILMVALRYVITVIQVVGVTNLG